MNRLNWKQRIPKIAHWLNTPSKLLAPRGNTLRLCLTPSLLGKYLFRLVGLATLTSALILFGCKSTTESSGNEYVGVWENPNLKGADVLDIVRDDNHFLVRKTWGTQIRVYPAILEKGVLYIADGSNQPYTYVKASDTLVTPGVEKDKEYRRKR